MNRTTNDIATEIESLIPPTLYAAYRHLSYGEMAQVPELEPWAEALLAAEREWNECEQQ